MKQTPLKRKTPLKAKAGLKATPFKKKPKRKKKPKSTLQRNKDKMDSRYWNNKCQEHVTRWAHSTPCLMSGKREPQVRSVCGHHMIRKSKSRLYRWHPN